MYRVVNSCVALPRLSNPVWLPERPVEEEGLGLLLRSATTTGGIVSTCALHARSVDALAREGLAQAHLFSLYPSLGGDKQYPKGKKAVSRRASDGLRSIELRERSRVRERSRKGAGRRDPSGVGEFGRFAGRSVSCARRSGEP